MTEDTYMATTTTPTDNRWNKGNSEDRRRRIQNMLRWWGNGTECACVWCGTTLCNNPGNGGGVAEDDHVSVDHIVCHQDGGRYTLQNLVPSCQTCNKSRGATDFDVWAARKGVDAGALRGHAEAYRPARKG